jgi:predicted nucleotidyltransferase
VADLIEEFVRELAERPDVAGVILTGSRARGNARPDSDADLAVIVPEGYLRGYEQRDGQNFELLYLSEAVAAGYFSANPDAAAEFGETAKILFDRDGAGDRVIRDARRRAAEGKPPVGEAEHRSSRFNAADQLRSADWWHERDPATGALVLQNKVLELTASFFDYRRLWTPSPKVRLARIAELEPRMHALLVDFYAEGRTFAEQLDLAERMLPLVYDV